MEIEYKVIVASESLLCGENTICGHTLNLEEDMLIFRKNNVGFLITDFESDTEEEEEEENE